MNADILHKEFNILLKELVQHHKDLGMEASGNWIKSLSIEAVNDKVEMKGVEYTKQLVNGRAPGTWPNIGSIEKWIKDKNIQSELKPSVLAFLISRKIYKEGTKYFRQKGTDLIDKVFTPEKIQKIIGKVSIIHMDDFVKLARGSFKQLAIN